MIEDRITLPRMITAVIIVAACAKLREEAPRTYGWTVGESLLMTGVLVLMTARVVVLLALRRDRDTDKGADTADHGRDAREPGGAGKPASR